MAENLIVSNGNKEQQYQTLLPQIESLLAGETDVIANMANISSPETDIRFLLGGFLQSKRRYTGTLPFSGATGLHTYPHRKRCLRYGMERGTYIGCTGCRAVPRSYRLQLRLQVGDRGTYYP